MNKVLRFSKPRRLKELDKLTINRGQRETILEFIAGAQMRADSKRSLQDLQDIYAMVYMFCQERA